MKFSLFTLSLTWAVLAISAPVQAEVPRAAPPQAVTFDRFGRVPLVHPSGPPRSVAVLLSGKEESSTLAKALADSGALVLTVDTAHYLEGFGHAGKCAYPAGDLEALAQYTEKTLDLPEYLHPILVGTGAGSAVVYASLAQAPENTFRGGVSLGFRPELSLPIPICRGNGLSRSRSADNKSDVLLPMEALNAPWRLLPGMKEGNADLERQQPFLQKMAGAQTVSLPPGSPSPESRRATLQRTYTELSAPPAPPTAASAPAAPDTGTPAVIAPTPPPEPVGDLPLVEVPTATPSTESFALLMSGDGGWAGIDKHLAGALNAQGLSVVGWDSLRYFWKKRTPEDTARDVARALTHYLAAWKTRSAVLVGYSRGADVLPAIVARLPAELRQRVRLVALVAPGRIAEFEVHVTDLLGGGGGTMQVLPEVQALGGTPVLCIFGDSEVHESVCPLLGDVKGTRSVMLHGGHHFGGDYARVAQSITDALAP
ncbi:AcvB/VirJ family lysyl-phosphatidylglycerol hydrolase [Hyalangium versicolor]|uniref:AcvB/VirJ family lysyl-phosphatidylglycerol hydrolase n=1 Tax=Hyalangium versicolor TaxID=2861190 RepID=UPI001CCF26BD|nr:AcvB/VirJ family lysyl-phosphatidylglycerol hydrolase [Hyalangium versicolor]